jgi:hypothetical protein
MSTIMSSSSTPTVQLGPVKFVRIAAEGTRRAEVERGPVTNGDGVGLAGRGRARGVMERRRGTLDASDRTTPTDGGEETVATAEMTTADLEELLGAEADDLLTRRCETISAQDLHLPAPDFVDPRDGRRRPLDERAAQPPFIVKLNHDELLTAPNTFDQIMFSSVQRAHELVTIEADIIKQKLPETNGGFAAVAHRLGGSYGKTHERPYDRPSDRPRALPPGQLPHGPRGAHQLRRRAVGRRRPRAGRPHAVINERAGGMGLISGRKSFQRPLDEGIELLHAIQDVDLSPDVTIA